ALVVDLPAERDRLALAEEGARGADADGPAVLARRHPAEEVVHEAGVERVEGFEVGGEVGPAPGARAEEGGRAEAAARAHGQQGRLQRHTAAADRREDAGVGGGRPAARAVGARRGA